MNKGMLTVGVIMLAIMALLLINVITNYSTGGELDYYLVKETVEAAMEDSVDMEFYRLTHYIESTRRSSLRASFVDLLIV